MLYELATLKHAFDANNMHALVLKIMRGKYPPPPSSYSAELRALITDMLNRDPAKRPNINQVLRRPVMQQRIRQFLTESVAKKEFEHTVLHNQHLLKSTVGGGAAQAAAVSSTAAAVAAVMPTFPATCTPSGSPYAARLNPSHAARTGSAPAPSHNKGAARRWCATDSMPGLHRSRARTRWPDLRRKDALRWHDRRFRVGPERTRVAPPGRFETARALGRDR